MSKLSILTLLACVVTIGSAAVLNTGRFVEFVQDEDTTMRTGNDGRGQFWKAFQEVRVRSNNRPTSRPSVEAPLTLCPKSTFAACESVMDGREPATDIRDICCGHYVVIYCMKSRKLSKACQSMANQMEVTARDQCKKTSRLTTLAII